MDEITYIWEYKKTPNFNNEININKIIRETTYLINCLQLYPKIIKEKNDSVYGDGEDGEDEYNYNDDNNNFNITSYETDGIINKYHIYFNNIYDANKNISDKNNKHETFLFVF